MSSTTATQKPKCDCDCDLLLWKNPVETGKYFFGAILALLILKKVNLITFFLRVGYTIFLTTGTIEFVSKIALGQGLVTKYGVKNCPNTVGLIKPYVDEFLKQLPIKQAKMRMLVFAYVPKDTFKAAVVLFCLHRFFSWFSVWTILFTAVIAVFTLPIIYKTYQKEIDATCEKLCKCAKQETDKYSKLACDKVQPHLEKLGLAKIFQAKTTPESTTAKLAAEVPVEGSTTSSHVLPSAPETEPSTSTKEFDVDQLTSELKESTNSLKKEFEKNA